MKKTPCLTNTLKRCAMLLALQPTVLFAGGFSLYSEASTVAVGDFAAGIAAEVPDASTGWYNPAGLVLLKKPQIVMSGIGVLPHIEMSGTSYFNTPDYAPYVQSFQHLSDSQPAAVPAIHWANPLGQNATFGLSLVSPFGMSTNWPVDSPVRYSGTFSQLMTVTLSPELGGAFNDHFSMGGGLDLQWSRVEFNSVIGAPAELQFLANNGTAVTATFFDSVSRNAGSSLGVGFHLGVLGRFNDDNTRLGVNYQSSIDHQYHGSSTLTGRLADPDVWNPFAVFRGDDLLSAPIELPSVTTVSLAQAMTPRMVLLGSVVYFTWSRLKETTLNNIAAFSLVDNAQTYIIQTIPQNLRDTWRFALGGKYQVNDQWSLRAGGGYDQTPTIAAERDVRMPDNDRWALSIGAHYQAYSNVSFDVGYTYLWAANDAILKKTTPLGPVSTNTILATAKSSAQLLGVQAKITAI